MGKKRILFTIPNFKTAGSQYVLLNIYCRLSDEIWEPWVLVEKFPEYIPDSIPENRRLLLAKEKPLPYIKKLRKLFRRHAIDLVHSWDYRSSSMEAIACKLSGVPYVYTKKNNSWSKRWFVKSILSTHIAYDNPEMKERFFNSSLLRKKISFVPHGVDCDLFKPSQIQRSVKNQFILGCVGIISPNKNQMFVVKALTQLPDNVVLQLFGKTDPDYVRTLEKYITDNGLSNRVVFNGFIPNEKLVETMRGFDVLVQSSVHEGLPLTILEAMACGIPVLASDSGGGARYLLNFGGGQIFDLDKPDDFLEKIKRFLRDETVRFTSGQSGRRAVEIHFNLSKEVRNYQNIYDKLVKNER